MYEAYYGFAEKPFSLTPDPKFLYRSPSHANAFELLQYAIRRREGFVVVTGDIGTGKTTICRALLEQIDRTTFTALVLNPFLSEEDLLKRILQDFGVVSRESIRAGRLTGVTKQDLIETLYDFLLGLIPLKANAVLIIDEAQNLPLPVLEQIRILSNLETDKEKLLQIILVGQLDLGTLLRSPGLRQLDQRVSIRYQLEPLDREMVGAYVAHRLTIAGGSAAVTFAPRALDRLHRLSGGIPRLINLICDRALLAAFSVRQNRITPDMVAHAAVSLDVRPSRSARSARFGRFGRPGASLAGAAAITMAVSVFAVGPTAYLYQRFSDRPALPAVGARGAAEERRPAATLVSAVDRPLPPDAPLSILVGSYPAGRAGAGGDVEQVGGVRALTEWLETSGYAVYYADVDLGPNGRWQQVLAGAYTDPQIAQRDADRLNAVVPGANARVIEAASAGRSEN
jgi:type II secretory pathway predicted ATPase ExeA